METKFDERFETALKSSEPFNELRAFALELISSELGQTEICEIFDSFRSKLRLDERENDEDIVTDVMDCIIGWCAPDYKLF